jgi:hypothetical protein
VVEYKALTDGTQTSLSQTKFTPNSYSNIEFIYNDASLVGKADVQLMTDEIVGPLRLTSGVSGSYEINTQDSKRDNGQIALNVGVAVGLPTKSFVLFNGGVRFPLLPSNVPVSYEYDKREAVLGLQALGRYTSDDRRFTLDLGGEWNSNDTYTASAQAGYSFSIPTTTSKFSVAPVVKYEYTNQSPTGIKLPKEDKKVFLGVKISF